MAYIGNSFVVQLLGHVQLFAISWTGAHQASLCITNSWSLLKLMSIELVMPSNYLILCHLHILLLSIFPTIRVFSSESGLWFRWLKCWSCSFSIRPYNEYLGLVGSPCSLRDSQESSPTPQFKSINSSAFSLLYGPTLTSIHDYGKIIALSRWTFVGKVMSLLFNILSMLVIAFLPRSKLLLIS